MKNTHTDALAPTLAQRLSRRRLGLLGVIATAGYGFVEDTAAKKKHKKRHKKKPKPQPTPPGPVALKDATCTFTEFSPAGYGLKRSAQTFRAIRTGQLTSASVIINSNPAISDIDVEIWSVNQSNAPSAFLAGTTVADVPLVAVGNTYTLSATFPTPAAVVSGTRYALVLTTPGTVSFVVSFTDPCADGAAYSQTTVNSPWDAGLQADLYFETVVVA
ncbi:MAG: hypothetical protein QM692_09590 [Thermomicrobiales bacterium]